MLLLGIELRTSTEKFIGETLNTAVLHVHCFRNSGIGTWIAFAKAIIIIIPSLTTGFNFYDMKISTLDYLVTVQGYYFAGPGGDTNINASQ